MIRTKRSKKLKRVMLVCFLSIAFLLFFGNELYASNFLLDTDNISFKSDKLDESFDGYKIAHLSDFHNCTNEKIVDEIFRQLELQKPDVIFITGDIVDRNVTDYNISLKFAKKLLEFAPVYYVIGNHEKYLYSNATEGITTFWDNLRLAGVTVLLNEYCELSTETGQTIKLFGIVDQSFYYARNDLVYIGTRKMCSEFPLNENDFNILLAHHPEQLEYYAEYDFDLVFSGHAHGGQFRFFGIGAIAPDQGIFPKYTSGEYSCNNTKMIVSRGIGNSTFPFRLFNKSHIIFLTLETE